ncbi:MAG: hypothetical protein AAAC47_01785 [Pararhizobium sp.]
MFMGTIRVGYEVTKAKQEKEDKRDWELWRRSMELAGQLPQDLAAAQIVLDYLQQHLENFHGRNRPEGDTTTKVASNCDKPAARPQSKPPLQLLRESMGGD